MKIRYEAFKIYNKKQEIILDALFFWIQEPEILLHGNVRYLVSKSGLG